MFVYFCVVLSLFAFQAAAISDEMLALAKQLHDTCTGSTGVDEGLIAKVNVGQFPNDDKLQCYMKCIMSEAGVMGDDGTVDEDAAIAMMPEEYKEKAEKVIKSCGTKAGSSACETAWLTNKCYQEQGGSDYHLI